MVLFGGSSGCWVDRDSYVPTVLYHRTPVRFKGENRRERERERERERARERERERERERASERERDGRE
jgi:hypothetical protein